MNSFKVLTLNQQNIMYNRIWHFRTMLENFHFFVLFFRQIMKITQKLRKLFSRGCDLTIFREKLSILYGKMRGWNGLSYHWGRRKVPNRRWERNSPIMLLFRTSRRKGYDRTFSCFDLRTGCSILRMTKHCWPNKIQFLRLNIDCSF